MNANALLLFTLALSALGPLAEAQEPGRRVSIDDTASIVLPEGWRLQHQDGNSTSLYVPLQKERPRRDAARDEDEADKVKPRIVIASEIGATIIVERRRNHGEAVRRIGEIAAEYRERVEPLLVAGWPAIERRRRGTMPQPGEAEHADDLVQTEFATVAVAVDATVYRLEAMLAPAADPRLLDQAVAIGRGLRVPGGNAETSRRELVKIQQLAKQKPGSVAAPAPAPGRQVGEPKSVKKGDKGAGIAVQVQPGVGELEVATNDGQHVVVAANSGFSFSDNAGATWTLGGGTPCNQALCDGDPSLAVGQSGAIYYSWIGGATLTTLGDGVSRSTDNGHTFTFRGLAAQCPGATGCTLADQEHIAADRSNASASSDDRIYNVWRDFGTAFSIRISCSTDGGTNWTGGTAIGAGDLPRVSVGGDGFVYVAWASGGNMQLHKFSNCDAGLAPQVGWPITVSAFTNVACPVPGLDRCNGRNILSSPKVAVDDLDANHLYYAFATASGAGNEDVMVFDSLDGGATFPRSVRANTAVAARRFMPWIAVYGGVATVGWYDRRNATAANNDLTRYFIGGAAVRGPQLVALAEADLSGASDNECSTWPAATDAITDSESCSVQPQLAGRCRPASGVGGSATPCDFSSTVCPTGETCQVGRGFPKYGDYNGHAAGAGWRFSAWSSSVPPASVGGTSGTIRVYASGDLLPSDFYVRDWNAAPNFDNGAQPSTNPIYWATSDVWNQATGTPSAPGPDGSVFGDAPSRTGSNFAFARVSRRAAAASTAPDATVTVNFFLADYGSSTPFASIGSETVTFAAGDVTKITPAHAWSVPAGASGHLCMGVQIDGPDGDNFALPSLAGALVSITNGIRDDNNKAQRNLQETVGTSAGTELIASIGNAGPARRPVKLRFSVPEGLAIDATVEVIGGKRMRLENGLVLTTPVLAPHANTWLKVHVSGMPDLRHPVPVHVFEDTRPPANGFSFLLAKLPAEEVARRNLADLAGLLQRVATLEKSASAEKLAVEATRAAHARDGISSFFRFHGEHAAALDDIVAHHLERSGGADRFQIREAMKSLQSAVTAKNADEAAAAAISVVERFDIDVTAGLRRRGIGTDYRPQT